MKNPPHAPGKPAAPPNLANLALVCFHHHTGIHTGLWHIHTHPDGTIWITPPPWLDPQRRPIRTGALRRATHQAHQLGQQLRLDLGKAQPD